MDIELIEKIVEELYTYALQKENRRLIEDAIKFFEYSGIKDSNGILPYVIFDGGLIEDFREFEEYPEYDALKDSIFSIFKVDNGGILDLINDKFYDVNIHELSGRIIIGRLVGETYLLSDYEYINNLDEAFIRKMLKGSKDPLIDIYRLVKAAQVEDTLEEHLLYEGEFAHTFTEEASVDEIIDQFSMIFESHFVEIDDLDYFTFENKNTGSIDFSVEFFENTFNLLSSDKKLFDLAKGILDKHFTHVKTEVFGIADMI